MNPTAIAGDLSSPLLLGLIYVLALPNPAASQSVRGLVVEADTGEPISGALVMLLDADSTAAATAMSSSNGAYYLRAPAPGTYRLRADRIGYGSTLSEPLELAEGESSSYRVEASTRPVELTALLVEGARDDRCRLSQDAGDATYGVWEEARKALENAAWTDRSRRYRLIGEQYTMFLDQSGRPLSLPGTRSERSDKPTTDSIITAAGYTLFKSLPARHLREIGYVVVVTEDLNERYAIFPGRPEAIGGTAYFGPDANVLLSEAFHQDHCFRLVEGEGRNEGMVGLSFQPARRPTLADIEGTLWLDGRTAQLHSLDFRYVGAVPARRGGLPGSGRVEFDRLSDGPIIVRNWWIQMPGLTTGVPHFDELRGWTRQGGRVTEVVRSGS